MHTNRIYFGIKCDLDLQGKNRGHKANTIKSQILKNGCREMIWTCHSTLNQGELNVQVK